MFRMWGKLWKDNRLVRDTVICQPDYSLCRTQMVLQSLDQDLVMNLIWASPSGWMPISPTSSGTTRPGSVRIILLNRLILIIWRSR